MSAPVFKQRKPRAATRPRAEQPAADEDDAADSPMLAAQARKKDTSRRKRGETGKTKLSFGGDDDEEHTAAAPFVPRKSTLSQSVSLQKQAIIHSAPASTGLPTPIAPASKSTYNQDYLAQLKASTPTRSTLAREPGLVVSYDEDGDTVMPSSSTADAIPDEAAIASAIARRRRHAAAGGGEGQDYISLTADTSRLAVYDHSTTSGGPHPESRLQRESDSEGEGDESLAAFTGAHERLGLRRTGGNMEHARRMRQEMRDALEHAGEPGEDEVGDEDEERWEDEQVRRAGAGGYFARKEETKTKSAYTSAKIPTARPLPSISLASTRLSTSLAYLVAERTALAASADATKRERERLEVQEGEVRQEVERVEGKREWMMEFYGWVEMLGGFLEEKVPLLDKIESDGLHHWRERKGMITSRRDDDDGDDVALFLGVAALPDGSTGGDEQQVDELGRTRGREPVGPYAGVRKSRREARTARRNARRHRLHQLVAQDSLITAAAADDDDGYSTDSSLSPADAEDYATALNALHTRAEALGQDVKAEAFRDPQLDGGVGYWFSEWRRRDEDEYLNAFGGLGCVQAWEYWARKEMVGWEPSRSHVSIDAFQWFHGLHAYSHPKPPAGAQKDVSMASSDSEEEEEAEEPPLAPEGDMAAAMVSGAVTRLVINAIEAGEYDPYSMKQTRRLVDLVDLISDYTGKEGGKYKALLKAILAVFLEQVQSSSTLIATTLQSTSIPPPAFDPASRSALKTFVNRRLKLIKNMLAWRRYAHEEVIQLVGMLLQQVIRPCLSRCWDSGGKELTEKVLQFVPETVMSVDMLAFFKPIAARP